MKNIVYLNNFMSPDIIKKRNNPNMYSQPANNKITGILDALLSVNASITVISNGLVNSKTRKLYKKVKEQYHGVDIVYAAIRDYPLINTLSSIKNVYKEIKKIHKQKKIDNIIFYNYKPEVAWAAYLAKKRLKIPITVEFEDGYSNIKDLGRFKSLIFRLTENVVSKYIDSAILVNSLLETKVNVPSTVVRGVVSEEFYEVCKNYKKERNDLFTILYSGGLDKSRGIDVLIKALNYIPYDLKLIITGKGHIENKDSRIEFKGFLPYAEMKTMMMKADLLIQCQLVKDSFQNVSFPSKI